MEQQAAESRRQAEAKAAERRRQAEVDEAERRHQLEAEADEAKRQTALAGARDKVKLFKKQVEIQAKLRKQQSTGSQYSVRSSRKSKSSKASRSIKAEVEQRLGPGFLNFNLGGHTSNVVKIGKTLRAAAEPKEPQNEPKEKETTNLALANGAAREPLLLVNPFEPGPTSVVERLQRGCTSQTLLVEASKSDPGSEIFFSTMVLQIYYVTSASYPYSALTLA